ncbi:tRNA lysidine(34) synthetase TilS [Legionella shakespearei]|uniref:tRNA(Ile)-lysidine synthase n=1 Tax=Legionella shakespearei DSM 23087 TaxID=1122169 RepID=A0A0W0YV49_9GAMM|nr:tRNA lysidine(34) synthetase TilS [Legionella shakespearei]KTD60748.1 cell cycle protein MesJ [Legionella shakespearei DSM 23087]
MLFNSDWVSRLGNFNQLIVGFSGGLDSTVLLHALASHPSLHSKLLAVHINHGISPNADFWQQHCQELANHLSVPFIAQKVEFNRSANIEEEARRARYAFFSSLLTENDCLLLGHHLNDQAETVLLQLFRGAGIDGLSAMKVSGHLGAGRVVRPFLSYSRHQLESYAASRNLKWIEDESNEDVNYSRNFLREHVMPLLESKWPGVAGTIARTAAHCQQARMNLDDLALEDCPALATPVGSLYITPLKSLALERITNVLRFWLKKNKVQLPGTDTFQRLIHEVIFARPDAMPLVSWDTTEIRRYQEHLFITFKQTQPLPDCIEWREFPKSLTVPAHGIFLSVEKAGQGLMIPDDAKITIQFRTGGESFSWRGQSKELKKLFQEWNIPPWLRARVPLLYINGKLAAVIGYAVSDEFFTRDSDIALLIVNK